MKTFVVIGKYGTGKDLLINLMSATRKHTAIIIEDSNNFTEERLQSEIDHARSIKSDLYIKAVKKEFVPKNILEKSTILYSEGLMQIIDEYLKEREEK